ncbi:MAG: AAA family ATPase [Opitutaceae bacterium]|jgi:hypothetical protein|nr:AAA family ATPase [Opitutaceae bacterium]
MDNPFDDENWEDARPVETPAAGALPGAEGGGGGGENPGVRPFTLWAPAEFLALPVDPNDFLLGAGIIQRGSTGSLVGVGGIGKTRLALWMVICMITGRKFLGLEVSRVPLRILFFSTENGCRRWKADLEKYRALIGENAWRLVEDHLRILALTPEEDGVLTFTDIKAVARLDATLGREKPDFVILDPFADIVLGDENKNSDVAETMRILNRLLHKNCPDAAGMVIHHARTGAANALQAGDNFNAGNFGRGGKALYSSVRSELQLVPADRDDATRMVLFCGKANDAPKFAPIGIIFDQETFEYRVDPDFDVEEWRANVSGERAVTSLTIRDVVEAVQELCPAPGDTVKTSEIRKKLNEVDEVSRATVTRRLTDAVNNGYLINPKRGVYRLGSKPLKQSGSR